MGSPAREYRHDDERDGDHRQRSGPTRSGCIQVIDDVGVAVAMPDPSEMRMVIGKLGMVLALDGDALVCDAQMRRSKIASLQERGRESCSERRAMTSLISRMRCLARVFYAFAGARTWLEGPSQATSERV